MRHRGLQADGRLADDLRAAAAAIRTNPCEMQRMAGSGRL